jgi:hypothetical protein
MKPALVLPVLLLLLLSGCKSIPEVAAVVSGGAAGVATGNPAIGFAVGVGVDAAANAGVRWYGQTRQQAEQDAIAAVAGPLDVGGQGNWQIAHVIPIGDEHGTLTVVRSIENPLAYCKEIVFSVESGKNAALRRSWYDADICLKQRQWKWASAEPAVERWGNLQ